ncbi:cytochrome P450 [Kutzneria sp. NPDC052558]|uniref:cytochrome P450 n=1 Tax=Kutzneria sp. NPDC052558 TaxID=3364121 RepID=UPI0037CA7670
MQRDEPLARITLPYGGDGWLVTRHEDAKVVSSDPRFARNFPVTEKTPRVTATPRRDETIGGMDAPQHTRLRGLVAKAFTARRIEQLRPRAQEVVDAALDGMAHAGPPADLVRHLALPLPITMICEMLGAPMSDRAHFQHWSTVLVSSTAYSAEELDRAVAEIRGYIAELVACRRNGRHDDLLADLVAARDNEDRLTEEELITFGVTLLIAGYETTANQLANFVYTLLTHPDQLRRLLNDPGLVPSAVEELLRFVPLGGGVGRTRVATADVQLPSGTVRAGEAVFIAGAQTNLDDRVFRNAAELDVGRDPNPHLTFGHGPHFCLGAHSARMQLQVALGSLLARFPKIRLAVPVEDVPWKGGLLMRGPVELPIVW